MLRWIRKAMGFWKDWHWRQARSFTRWLKRSLRRWLLDVPADDGTLEVRTPKGLVKMTPTGIRGLAVLGTLPDGSPRVATEGTAVDREAFWRAWRRLGGRMDGWTWEDGTSYVPGE